MARMGGLRVGKHPCHGQQCKNHRLVPLGANGARLDDWLDAGYGSRALARNEVRTPVAECLLRFNEERLLLHTGVMMPTHVHLLMEPLGEQKLRQLMKGIKGASARKANQVLETSGTFWLDESFDHIVRSEEQYHYYLRYVAENPVKAGLASHEYWLYPSQCVADIPVCRKEDS